MKDLFSIEGKAALVTGGSSGSGEMIARGFVHAGAKVRMMNTTLERFEDSIQSSNPMGRIGQPEDMAGIEIYLSSRAGAYVTGAVIPVDGGIPTTT